MVGGTGKMGRYIVQELSQSRFHIRSLVRNHSDRNIISSENIEQIEGSLNDFAKLENAVEGVQGVFLNFPRCWNSKPEKCRNYLEGLKNLIVLARIHKVEHIVVHMAPWQAEQDGEKDLFTFYRKGLELLKLASIPLTAVQATLFMETFPEFLQKGKKVRVLAGFEEPIHWISVRDLGKLVAQIFFNSDSFDKTIQLKGREAFTLEEAAQKFADGTLAGKPLKLQSVSYNALRFWSMVRDKGQEDLAWFSFIRQHSEEKFPPINPLISPSYLSFSEFLEFNTPDLSKTDLKEPTFSS